MKIAAEVISLRVQPVEIGSFVNRIGLLDVQRDPTLIGNGAPA